MVMIKTSRCLWAHCWGYPLHNSELPKSENMQVKAPKLRKFARRYIADGVRNVMEENSEWKLKEIFHDNCINYSNFCYSVKGQAKQINANTITGYCKVHAIVRTLLTYSLETKQC